MHACLYEPVLRVVGGSPTHPAPPWNECTVCVFREATARMRQRYMWGFVNTYR